MQPTKFNPAHAPPSKHSAPMNPFRLALWSLLLCTMVCTFLFWWTKRIVFQVVYTVSMAAHLGLSVWLDRRGKEGLGGEEMGGDEMGKTKELSGESKGREEGREEGC